MLQNCIVGLFAKSKGKSVYQNHHVNSFYVFNFEDNEKLTTTSFEKNTYSSRSSHNRENMQTSITAAVFNYFCASIYKCGFH